MAEQWQKWFPFYIDRFRGSPDVQAMTAAARLGYIYLLAAAWQSDSCSIPADPFDLASLSGLGDDMWALHGPRILRKFSLTEGGRLQNATLLLEWNKAKRIFEARSKSGRDTTDKRFRKQTESVTVTNGDGDRAVSEGGPSRSTDTKTETETSTNTKTNSLALTVCTVRDADVERVYLAYPRHVGKAKALEAIRRAVAKLGANEHTSRLDTAGAIKFLHEKVTRYAQSPSGSAGKFTPHPATWFNAGRYHDDEGEWYAIDRGNASINRGQAREDSAFEALRRANEADRDEDEDQGIPGDAWDCAERSDGRDGAARLLEGA